MRKYPLPEAPPTPVSYLSWLRWPAWLILNPVKGEALSTVGCASVYEIPSSSFVDELKQRCCQCESRINNLETIQKNIALISTQAVGQVPVTAEMLEVLYLGNELKDIITLLTDFDTRTLQILEKSTSYDHFTYSYFCLVDETYHRLAKLIYKEQPPLHETHAMVVRCLYDASKSIAHPNDYRKTWFAKFDKDFCEPDAVLYYFKKTTQQHRVKSNDHPETRGDSAFQLRAPTGWP